MGLAARELNVSVAVSTFEKRSEPLPRALDHRIENHASVDLHRLVRARRIHPDDGTPSRRANVHPSARPVTVCRGSRMKTDALLAPRRWQRTPQMIDVGRFAPLRRDVHPIASAAPRDVRTGWSDPLASAAEQLDDPPARRPMRKVDVGPHAISCRHAAQEDRTPLALMRDDRHAVSARAQLGDAQIVHDLRPRAHALPRARL